MSMSAALALLKSPLARWAAVGIIVAALGLALYVQGLRLDAAELRAGAERDRADANAAVVRQLQEDAERTAQRMAQYAAEVSALQEKFRADHDAILRQASDDCGDDAACRVALERLRARRGAPAPGQPDRAGGPR